MNGLIVLLVVFYMVFAMRKAGKEKPKGAFGGAARRPFGGDARAPRQTSPDDWEQAVSAPAQPAAPSAPLGEGASSFQEAVRLRTERMARPAREIYVGSLGVSSAEGEDLCDPALGHADAHAPKPAESSGVYENEIGSETLPTLNARAVLQGVVMSEILARPARRKWGRG